MSELKKKSLKSVIYRRYSFLNIKY